MKKILTAFIILVLVFCTACSVKKMYDQADLLLPELELEKKIGQMMIFAFPGKQITPAVSNMIEKYNPGGLILFGYNIGNKNQLVKMIDDLQSVSLKESGTPLFISVDQEGGRVKRIQDGVTQFPGNMAAGVAGDEDLVYDWARILGLQLRSLGVNMNLAPSVDVNNNPANPVINTRSFGPDPESVSCLGRAYIEGIQKSRCIASAKHFPGHGDTSRDSHLVLPVVRYGMDRLEKVELVPFNEAIDARVDTVMSAHIAFPELSGNDPATLSPFFLTELLRKKMKFDGVVLTDDLEMKAVSGGMDAGEGAVRSVLAGVDIVLISSYGKNIPLIKNALLKAVKSGRIKESRINQSVRRILELKLRYGIMKRAGKSTELCRFVPNDEEKEILNSSEKVNRNLSRKGVAYHGKLSLLHPPAETERIFISANTVFSRELRPDANDSVIESADRLAALKKSSNKRIAYLFCERNYLRVVKRAADICSKKEIELVLISSADPFPIALSALADNMLFTFSGTPESLKQAACCLAGDFVPADLDKFFPGMVRTR